MQNFVYIFNQGTHRTALIKDTKNYIIYKYKRAHSIKSDTIKEPKIQNKIAR